MPSVDTMPTSSDPGGDLNSKWATEQSRLQKSWYDSGQRELNPLGGQDGRTANQSFADYQNSFNTNPGMKRKLDDAKQQFMSGEFQNTQGQLVDNMQKNAQAYRADQPGLENQLYNQINFQSKQDLAGQQQNIRRNASSRGLLYSGLETGSENQAAAATATSAASARSQVAPALEKQGAALEQAAIQAQQAKQVSDLQIANNVYDQALSDYKSNIAGMNSMYKGVGQVVGGYFGSKAGS